MLALSGSFLWIVLVPAAVCLAALLAIMSFLRWSVTNFERDIAGTFALIQECMRIGLALAFPHPTDAPVDLAHYQRLKVELLARSIRLNENYSQAAFELRIGRLSCKLSPPVVRFGGPLFRRMWRDIAVTLGKTDTGGQVSLYLRT